MVILQLGQLIFGSRRCSTPKNGFLFVLQKIWRWRFPSLIAHDLSRNGSEHELENDQLLPKTSGKWLLLAGHELEWQIGSGKFQRKCCQWWIWLGFQLFQVGDQHAHGGGDLLHGGGARDAGVGGDGSHAGLGLVPHDDDDDDGDQVQDLDALSAGELPQDDGWNCGGGDMMGEPSGWLAQRFLAQEHSERLIAASHAIQLLGLVSESFRGFEFLQNDALELLA